MNFELELNDDFFNKFAKKAHLLTGIFLAPEKKVMLSGRLRRRILDLELQSYEEYYSFLCSSKEEEKNFVDVITTNETYFYRTPRVWDFFTNTYLKEFYKKYPQKTLRVWSGAASSGEEAHTLAIFCEQFKSQNPGFNYKIVGTDISEEILDKAKAGLYKGRAIERFRNAYPQLFKLYMKGDDNEGFKLVSSVKNNIEFKQHNLLGPTRLKEKFDLVFLRNVLIYFNNSDQEKALYHVSQCMNPDSILIIGESESLNRLNTPFMSLEPLVYSLKSQSKEAAA